MSYFNCDDNDVLIDALSNLQDLLDEHKNFDSIELVENSEEFEKDFTKLLKMATNAADDVISSYEECHDEMENLATQVQNLNLDIADLENEHTDSNDNLYELMKKRICLDMLRNLNLEQLEHLENVCKQTIPNYSTFTLNYHF